MERRLRRLRRREAGLKVTEVSRPPLASKEDLYKQSISLLVVLA
jgi:hypothetical protein